MLGKHLTNIADVDKVYGSFHKSIGVNYIHRKINNNEEFTIILIKLNYYTILCA